MLTVDMIMVSKELNLAETGIGRRTFSSRATAGSSKPSKTPVFEGAEELDSPVVLNGAS